MEMRLFSNEEAAVYATGKSNLRGGELQPPQQNDL